MRPWLQNLRQQREPSPRPCPSPPGRPAGKKGQSNSAPPLCVERAPTSLPRLWQGSEQETLWRKFPSSTSPLSGRRCSWHPQVSDQSPVGLRSWPRSQAPCCTPVPVWPDPLAPPTPGWALPASRPWLAPNSDPFPAQAIRPRPILPSRLRLRFGLQHSANRQ